MHIIQYNRWLAHPMEDADLTAELQALQGDNEAIREAFGIDLSFGTAGMRGIIGVGTGRMNIYTVRRAAQGLANHLKKTAGENPSVAIGYDSRIKSDLFAREAARVLVANAVAVRLFLSLQPVPVVSFAVRALHASAGIMITASHNPAKYNGFKVYGPDGCQMNTAEASAVLGEVEKLDIFDDVAVASLEEAKQGGWATPIGDDVLEAYYQNVRAQQVRRGQMAGAGLRVVYSPLNGAGNVPVRRVLADCGLTALTVVPQQEAPDGNFPTCPSPNPENREALELGIQLARSQEADLVLATDPDADRVGIAVRDAAGEYALLSGNEVGVLLLNYIVQGKADAGTLPKRPVVVKSIVTTPMADAVAAASGVECDNVLTGFKYIGGRIAQLEAAGEAERFVFGFEESYGYLAGTYVRDKDAVVASLLICEAAAFYKGLGITLQQAMEELYAEYGRYLNEVENFAFDGLAGMEKMDEIMAQLRETPPAEIGGQRVVAISDYETHTRTEVESGVETPLELPSANVLAYELEGGSRVTVRPSGTEPKVKVYYAIRDDDLQKATALRQKLAASMRPMMS